ncbi:MAG: PQQ-like beta-propeller repeat protein [Bryobacterales bacterium]|nr:PQQ-like beta-propeller repeat protein [Bryobacterales bacterium]
MSLSSRCRVGLGAVWLATGALLIADDWPEWRGAGRQGVWEETGVLNRFPSQGLAVVWREPLGQGYAGPSVLGGRVFVTDFLPGEGSGGSEGLIALDQRTGDRVWTYRWPANYAGLQYASGPRATPTVDGDRVYALGTEGTLVCASVSDGSVLWERSFTRDFDTKLPPWGMSSAPIIHGDLLIAIVFGRPQAKVVAFDKLTGEEVWRALSSEDSGPGYSQPILVRHGGRLILVIWHAGGLAALTPTTGTALWEDPFPVRMETPIATPVWNEPYLLISAFFNGSRLYRLGRSGAHLHWKGSSDSAVDTDGLHALMNSPVIDGEHVYGICSYGQLRCLRLSTGERVWETQAVTRERARNASAFIVRNGNRYFISNDRGELIIAQLTPTGYTEFDRTSLIRPTSAPGARRELGAVHWSHPAYAGRSVFVRNDEEILRASLAAE